MPSYSLDGVPLDHPAGCWRTKKGTQRRPWPGARAVKVSVPGRRGDIPVVGLDLEATTFGLTFKVTSANPSGANGGYEQMERNLEALSALLGTRHRLMKLRYQAGSLVRVADVTITAASEPEVNTGAATAPITAVVEVPGTLWRDEAEPTWAGAPNQLAQAVTTLAGSTGPITDALLRFAGPAVQPSIGDVALPPAPWISQQLETIFRLSEISLADGPGQWGSRLAWTRMNVSREKRPPMIRRQVGVLDDGTLAGPDARSQTRQIFADIERLLDSLAVGHEHLVKLMTLVAGH
ncbi:RidA family protein [Nonomuraea sp. NPDC050022]|uniref:RidA family protein n=1 Tax=unclassified Nonomuraea TaxID=2593643 RepID=UPI0033DE249A